MVLYNQNLKTAKESFFSIDYAMIGRLQELGRATYPTPQILDFKKLLIKTQFPVVAQKILSALEKAYDYPVDIEFTANFNQEGNFKFNLLQCRPLKTKGMGISINIPKLGRENIFFSSIGNFMGGNVSIPLDYVIFVRLKEYLELREQDKYQIARIIGMLNGLLKGKSNMLIGPGRWGTTTPSLGVPIHFYELCNMTVLCEVSYKYGNVYPELSFGSHFFQDMVEFDIFYAAIFDGEPDVVFNSNNILDKKNILEEVLPAEKKWENVLHLIHANGLTLYSDITKQEVLCGTFNR